MSIETDVDSETDANAGTSQLDNLGRELGDAIADVPEYRAFEESRQAVQESEKAQAKIEVFESQRQDFMLARQTGQATEEDLQQLQRSQQELHSIPVMAEYLEAQNELEGRLEALNDAVSEPLVIDFDDYVGGCCQD